MQESTLKQGDVIEVMFKASRNGFLFSHLQAKVIDVRTEFEDTVYRLMVTKFIDGSITHEEEKELDYCPTDPYNWEVKLMPVVE